MIAEREYVYEISRRGDLIAIEEDRFTNGTIAGVRRSIDGSSRFEAESSIDENGLVTKIALRYVRGPFSRSATYEAESDFIRGSVAVMGGRTVETAKLGRFREVDGGLVLFKALIIAHVRERAQSRFTGRVAMIDPNTLVAGSFKQTCRRKDADGRHWIYEQRMGDEEEIETDDRGVIVRIRDNRGQVTALKPSS
jgi:hypothetical protein